MLLQKADTAKLELFDVPVIQQPDYEHSPADIFHRRLNQPLKAVLVVVRMSSC